MRHFAQRYRFPFTAVFGRVFFPLLGKFLVIGTSVITVTASRDAFELRAHTTSKGTAGKIIRVCSLGDFDFPLAGCLAFPGPTVIKRFPFKPGLAAAASQRNTISMPAGDGDVPWMAIPGGGSLSSKRTLSRNFDAGASTLTRAVPPAEILIGMSLRILKRAFDPRRPVTATLSSWAGTRCR